MYYKRGLWLQLLARDPGIRRVRARAMTSQLSYDVPSPKWVLSVSALWVCESTVPATVHGSSSGSYDGVVHRDWRKIVEKDPLGGTTRERFCPSWTKFPFLNSRCTVLDSCSPRAPSEWCREKGKRGGGSVFIYSYIIVLVVWERGSGVGWWRWY